MDIKAILLSLLLFLISSLIFAQNSAWKKYTVDDSIFINSRVGDTLLNGETRQLLNYTIECSFKGNYSTVVKVLKEVSKHSAIFDYTERSEKVKGLSPSQWIIYYYLDLPWPLPNSDAVYLMTVNENEHATTIEMISSPESYPQQKVKRTIVGHSMYTITKMEKQTVNLKIHTLSVPVSDAPDWMAKAWFPDGPAGIIRNIASITTKNK